MTGMPNPCPKKAGVIGWPIAQSRSPLIHQSWLKDHAINGTYEKYAVKPEELEGFIKNLKQEGFQGLNLTIPHKEAVIPLVDHITDDALTIGAANTLWFENDQLIAGNTDAYGFITHLKTTAPLWQKTTPALVIGAGGAARAVLHALGQEGVPQIFLTNRTKERAETLAAEFSAKAEFGAKISVINWDEKETILTECGLLVNTTSLGMVNKPPLEINIDTLPQTAVVYDIVYVPLETALLTIARKKGLQIVDGLGMLLHQAVPGFEKWFGARPEVTKALYQKVLGDINQSTENK